MDNNTDCKQSTKGRASDIALYTALVLFVGILLKILSGSLPQIDAAAWLEFLSVVLVLGFIFAWFHRGVSLIKTAALAVYQFGDWLEKRHERQSAAVKEQWVQELERSHGGRVDDRIEIDEILIDGKPLIGKYPNANLPPSPERMPGTIMHHLTCDIPADSIGQ